MMSNKVKESYMYDLYRVLLALSYHLIKIDVLQCDKTVHSGPLGITVLATNTTSASYQPLANEPWTPRPDNNTCTTCA